MTKSLLISVGLIVSTSLAVAVAIASAETAPVPAPATEPDPSNHLVVLWTSGDPDVAHNVCFMYTLNAKKQAWFENVTLIVWGPSSRLLAGDRSLQEELKAMGDVGVDLKACVVCAKRYGVVDDLKQLGLEVKPMGKPLSDYIKSGCKVITF